MGPLVELPSYFSKKVFFLLFNAILLSWALLDGMLRWDVVSIVSGGIALGFMNWMALIAARKYKGKYRGW